MDRRLPVVADLPPSVVAVRHELASWTGVLSTEGEQGVNQVAELPPVEPKEPFRLVRRGFPMEAPVRAAQAATHPRVGLAGARLSPRVADLLACSSTLGGEACTARSAAEALLAATFSP